MTGYPIIMNGDHAEFERDHANTPPKERPDWPLPSFNARDWAEAFCKIAQQHGIKDAEGKPIDEGWMITWFANALMRGFDEHAGRVARTGLLEAAIPFAKHDWMDAELEDDNCKLTKHSGPITVGHWRALRAAIAKAE